MWLYLIMNANVCFVNVSACMHACCMRAGCACVRMYISIRFRLLGVRVDACTSYQAAY